MAKRPRDLNQLAKLVVDIATGEVADPVSEVKRTPDRQGRAGGLRGGTARAEALTPQRRKEIAQSAAHTRWKRTGDS